MEDYIILVDEEGTPYIAHANRPSGHSTSQRPHKYIKKIKVGNGPKDYRYFYSEEEYQKYLVGEHRKQLSARSKMQREDEARSEVARLKKELNRWQRAGEKARKNGQNELYKKAMAKYHEALKRQNYFWEIGYGKKSGTNINGINWDV